MKRSILAVATLLMATSAGAEHVYGGFAEGDADLYPYDTHGQGLTAIQPGVGSGADVYGDFARGNTDLFSLEDRGTSAIDRPDRSLPDIYHEFGDTPDLSW